MIAMEAEVRPPVVQETVATERENGSVLDLSEINAVREGYELVGWMVTFDGQDVYLTKRTAEVVDYADGFAPNAEIDDVEEDSEKPTETTEPDDEEISDDEVFPETEAYGTETASSCRPRKSRRFRRTSFRKRFLTRIRLRRRRSSITACRTTWW